MVKWQSTEALYYPTPSIRSRDADIAADEALHQLDELFSSTLLRT